MCLCALLSARALRAACPACPAHLSSVHLAWPHLLSSWHRVCCFCFFKLLATLLRAALRSLGQRLSCRIFHLPFLRNKSLCTPESGRGCHNGPHSWVACGFLQGVRHFNRWGGEKRKTPSLFQNYLELQRSLERADYHPARFFFS